MASARLTLFWLLALPVLVFTGFFLIPLGVVLVSSFTAPEAGLTLAHYARILLDAYHWQVIATTFRIAIFSTLICVALGYPLAWYLVRIVQLRSWRRACVILLVLPLFTSNIVRSFGWMVLLGRSGLVNDALMSLGLIDRPMRFLGTETGILIGMVYILLPFTVLTIGTALARVDRGLEQAARDLGATPARAFWSVTFPLTLHGVMAGAIIVFSMAISAYVTPALLSGGKVTVLAMLAFQQYSTVFDFHYGGALSITLLVLTLALIGLASRMTRGRTTGAGGH
ncbi:ABC transporter permease [Cereibacter johrii]|uniref:ABC transporter permease n=1 Tax=Cereibacter johrii TaxID=445629 RepID=UPI000C6EE87A|nr:ABC transporter permease [Cereibacter johrii]MEA5160653.1 ABC transporter permease [Cereibacter johrii]RAZ84854.1 ABC transporter permease [Cereibacter johrii]RDS97066.1 ABC transporter permease [Cereibacter sphaeroides f. sp. denitrificans]